MSVFMLLSELLLTHLIEFLLWSSRIIGVFNFTKKYTFLLIEIVNRKRKNRYASAKQIATEQDHNDMWRWNQRLFRSRHPKLYSDFDIVDMQLGQSWWAAYPKQDWIVVDDNGDQIGTFCLVPLSRDAFNKVARGEIKETDLLPSDLISQSEIFAHQYWYVANYMIARRNNGVPGTAKTYVEAIIKETMFERMLNDEDFATKVGRPVYVIAFVEARSLERMATSFGFQKANPYDNHNVFSMKLDTERVRDSFKNAVREKNAILKELKKVKKRPLFRQPPNFPVFD